MSEARKEPVFNAENIIEAEVVSESKAETIVAQGQAKGFSYMKNALLSLVVSGVASTGVFYVLNMMGAEERLADANRLKAVEISTASLKTLTDQVTGQGKAIADLSNKLTGFENTQRQALAALTNRVETLTTSGISPEIKADLERLKQSSGEAKVLSERLSLLDTKQSETSSAALKTFSLNAGQQLLGKLERGESFNEEYSALNSANKALVDDATFALSAKQGFITPQKLVALFKTLKPLKQEEALQPKSWVEEKFAPFTGLVKIKRKDDVAQLDNSPLAKALSGGDFKLAQTLWQNFPEDFRKNNASFEEELNKAAQQMLAKNALKAKLADLLK